MVNVIVLCIELLLDVVGLVLGIIVFFRSSDNRLQKAWGMLAITLSLLLLCDNLEWIWLFSQGGIECVTPLNRSTDESSFVVAYCPGDCLTNPQYALQDLLNDLNTNENRLDKALHYDGFSGFRDFINFHRLQYFKEQARLQKDLSVKELMFMSGFTSRSSFYRYFANVEKMSPGEYMDMLHAENK